MSGRLVIEVSDEFKNKVKLKAQEQGLSLSDYIRNLLDIELENDSKKNFLSDTKSAKKAHEYIKIWVVSVQELKELAASKGFKSISAFIRFLIYSDRNIYSETDIDMVYEMRKIGVNINQIAKAHNQNKSKLLTDNELYLLNNLEKLLTEFIQLINKR